LTARSIPKEEPNAKLRHPVRDPRASFLLLVPTVPADAQAIRTWVSGAGNDDQVCSVIAPCKTFTVAHAKTAAGGEINCLDPGGFGSVTITKSITIDCLKVQAGVLAAGLNGITIDAPGIVVRLRGLSIDGLGTGLVGVNFIRGARLYIEKCSIASFQAGAAQGVRFIPDTAAELYVNDTVISENGTAATGAGIFVQPSRAAPAKVVLDGVQLLRNAQGLRVDGTLGATGTRRVTVTRSEVAGNLFQGIVATTNSAAISILVNSTAVSNNGSIGIQSDGAQSVIMIGNNVITGNDVGISATASGTLVSYLTNTINLNITNDGAPTGTQAPQ
jgi:hypothetical protein